jgi:hypothetical protein
VISPGHFVGDIEWIVFENDRFAVVAKREGFPADVARDENLARVRKIPAAAIIARVSVESSDP